MAKFIYAAGTDPTRHIMVFNYNDLTTVSSIVTTHPYPPYGIQTDGTFVYSISFGKIIKHNIDDLSEITGRTSWGVVNEINPYILYIDGDYIYIGATAVGNHKKLLKLDKDLNLISTLDLPDSSEAGHFTKNSYGYYVLQNNNNVSFIDFAFTGATKIVSGYDNNGFYVDDSNIYTQKSVSNLYKWDLSGNLITYVESPTAYFPQFLLLNNPSGITDRFFAVELSGGWNKIISHSKSDLSRITIASNGEYNTSAGVSIKLDSDGEYIYIFGYQYLNSPYSRIVRYSSSLGSKLTVSDAYDNPIDAYKEIKSIAFVNVDYFAPTGLTVSNVGYINATLDWTNLSNVGQNVIQRWNGSSWVDEYLVNYSVDTYNLSLAPSTEYTYRVSLLYAGTYYPSSSVTFTTLNAYKPTGLTTSDIICDGFDITWVNNVEAGDYDSINVWLYDAVGSGWGIVDVLSGDSTGYTFTDLYSAVLYIAKVEGVLGSYEMESSNVLAYTKNAAPTGLTATTIGYTDATLEWGLPCSGYGDSLVLQQKIGNTWTTVQTLSNTGTTYSLTGLRLYTEYTYRVSALKDTRYNHGAQYTFRTKTPPPDFCSDQHYDISGSTCGSQDGTISIDDIDYQLFYDFVLTDAFGNSYSLTGQSVNVASGYYFLTAVPKTEFAYYYKNTCGFSWLAVEDSDTTMTLNPVVRPTTTSYLISAGESAGRIYMDYTDSVSGLTHDYYLYTSSGEEKLAITGSTGTTDFYLTPIDNGIYYAIIVNENGCKTLYGEINVKNNNSPFNLSGVKRVFISEYKDDIQYNTWKTSDEDYFVQALDTLKFQSAKIKTYIDANTWYELPTADDTIFTQKLEKVRQGFIFRNTLMLSFSPSSYNKWLATKQLLENRYIVVFEDLNGFWWTFGYDNQGAMVNAYSRVSDYNYYQFEIVSNSGDKIMTAIDYNNYVLPYIINS